MIARLRYKITQFTTSDVKAFWIELCFLLALIFGVPAVLFSVFNL